MQFLGLTFTFLGEFMIGYTAIAVHYRFWKEHRVDRAVFTTMQKERIIGMIGLTFIILGYLIQLLVNF